MRLGRSRYTDIEADARVAIHSTPITAIHGMVNVLKTSDEVVNNSTTLQNDDELFLPAGANEVWAVEIYIRGAFKSSSDFKFQWSVPAGAGFVYGCDYEVEGDYDHTHGAPYPYIVPDTANYSLGMKGTLYTGATPGNLQLQWAQNSAAIEDTTVEQNSYIRAHRLV